ncbi:MAG: monophosphatase [Gaiellales bacterium]|jgi:fructose-1,6-bisphosphatase/inositol monophosphatase family enzyme|nr:monophosphatase [Gaiellales bacterium]
MLLGVRRQVVGHAGGSFGARVELRSVPKFELMCQPSFPSTTEQEGHDPSHISRMPQNFQKGEVFAGISQNLSQPGTRSPGAARLAAMTAATPNELLTVAVEAAHGAGELLLERFRRPATGIGRKSSSTDMVSDADRDAETLIRDILERRRPQDAILGEEGGSTSGESGLRWIVDPLDGTTNYLYGRPEWSVSVAVESGDGVIAGVVHDPSRAETFTAVRGGGAALNGEPISASALDDLSRALISTGFSYLPEERVLQSRALDAVLPRVRDLRRNGSAAIDLAWVACGRADGYYEVPIMVWDRAAGLLLVEEAGGLTSSLVPIGQGGDGIVAAGRGIHAELAAVAAGGLVTQVGDQLH